MIWTHNRSLAGQQGISSPVSLLADLLAGLFSHLSDLEAICAPSIFKTIRSPAALLRSAPKILYVFSTLSAIRDSLSRAHHDDDASQSRGRHDSAISSCCPVDLFFVFLFVSTFILSYHYLCSLSFAEGDISYYTIVLEV